MLVFWERGYEATSIRDIVARSRVNQFSIYSLYGDKTGLFLAVLDRYRDVIVEGVFGVVEKPDAGLEAIRAYFANLIEAHSVTFRAMGCLMTNSMADGAADDSAIRERTRLHFERLRVGFTRALENARRNGEIRGSVDVAQAAEYLAVTVQGLAMYSRVNPDRTALQGYVDTALSLVTGPAW